MTDYREYKLDMAHTISLLLGCLAACLLIGEIFYGKAAFAALSPFVYIMARKPYSLYMARKRRLAIRDQFRDVLYSFSASFATGRHMREAMKEAIPYISDIHGPGSPMAIELKNMVILLESTGEGELTLWQDFGERSGLEDVMDFASVFRACRDTGGDLVGAASRAAEVISEKITLEAEIKTMAAQRKFEGRIIGIMPIIMIGFLRMTSPGYMDAMYKTSFGRIVMTLALFAMGFAIYLTEKITEIRV